jgi:hypothetical protein
MANNIVLHMGFINTPYTKETMTRPATSAKEEMKRQRRRSFSKTMTAEDVANILENRYNIVETFSAIYEEKINRILLEGFSEVASSAIKDRGGSTIAKLKNLMKPNTKRIENMFKEFLNNEEMNGMVEGVPTGAALEGKRRGRKSRSGGRPSFVDTGIYRASFRCWADTK